MLMFLFLAVPIVLVAGMIMVPLLAQRRARWALVTWLPLAVLTWSALIYLFAAFDTTIPKGPGGGGEGPFVVMVTFARLIAVVLAGAVLVAVPVGNAWHWRGVAGGLLVCTVPVGALLAFRAARATRTTAATIVVRVTDPAGAPVQATVEYAWVPNPRPSTRNPQRTATLRTDADGQVKIEAGEFSSLTLKVATPGDPEREQFVSLSWSGPGTAVLHANWKLPPHNELSQDFYEAVRGDPAWRIDVEMPLPHWANGPLPYRRRLARRAATGPASAAHDHPDAFANLAGFEFAPAIARAASDEHARNDLALDQLQAMLRVADEVEEMTPGPKPRREANRAAALHEARKRGRLRPEEVGPLLAYLAEAYQHATGSRLPTTATSQP